MSTLRTTTPSAHSTSSTTPCGFLCLPGELRNEIYAHLLTTPHRRGPLSASKLHPQLLCTCRQIHTEATPLLYARNGFTIAVQPDMVLFPRSPRLRTHPTLALARDWVITISLFEPGRNQHDHAADLATSLPKLKRNLRAICLMLAAHGPQRRVEITVLQNLALAPALYRARDGLLTPFVDVRAAVTEFRWPVPQFPAAGQEAAREAVRQYVQGIEAAMRPSVPRLDGPDLLHAAHPVLAPLLHEATAYAAAFFATPTPWVLATSWPVRDGLDDLPQAMDLAELLFRRGPQPEPYDECVWEEALRLNHMAEFKYRLQPALEVLERRFQIIDEARQIVAWLPPPSLAAIKRLVDHVRVHPDTFGSSDARAKVLDRAFGLLSYVAAFEEPMPSQSERGMEKFHLAFEDRGRLSYDERAESFLPASLARQIKKSYEDLLRGEVDAEELIEAAVEVKEWCEVAYAEIRDKREEFLMRPLWRIWLPESASKVDWRDEIM